MALRVQYHTDPACPRSWAAEPALRRLLVEFGADLEITYVMGGLARDFEPPHEGRIREWLDAADRSGMPVDPRLWAEGAIGSSYPACMAVKAAQEQAGDGGLRYLRALREGVFCFRRKLDTVEALVEEARGAGLDPARFRIDLGSHATVEAFGADLERTRALEGDGLPLVRFAGEAGEQLLGGDAGPDDWSAAARAVGGRPAEDRPRPLAALERFGRMAAVEVTAACGLPGPRAEAELWSLAAEWRVRPVRVLTGWLFERA